MTEEKIYLVKFKDKKPLGRHIEITPEELIALKILIDVEITSVKELRNGQAPYIDILEKLLKKLDV